MFIGQYGTIQYTDVCCVYGQSCPTSYHARFAVNHRNWLRHSRNKTFLPSGLLNTTLCMFDGVYKDPNSASKGNLHPYVKTPFKCEIYGSPLTERVWRKGLCWITWMECSW